MRDQQPPCDARCPRNTQADLLRSRSAHAQGAERRVHRGRPVHRGSGAAQVGGKAPHADFYQPSQCRAVSGGRRRGDRQSGLRAGLQRLGGRPGRAGRCATAGRCADVGACSGWGAAGDDRRRVSASHERRGQGRRRQGVVGQEDRVPALVPGLLRRGACLRSRVRAAGGSRCD